jgi:hypothetical protein
MRRNTARLEAFASGNEAQVARWRALLRRAGIAAEERRFCDEHRPTRPDYVELWVDAGDVERARAAIRRADDADVSLMW